MSEANPVSTPMSRLLSPHDPSLPSPDVPFRSLLGSLLYLSIATRPDISAAVIHLSTFQNHFSHAHWYAALRILRYLKGTRDLGLTYTAAGSCESICGNSWNPLAAYSDSDFGGTPVDRRSTTGFINFINGAPVSWKTQIQPTVALSTLEAEYMAMSRNTQEILWLRQLLADMGAPLIGPTTLFVDNEGAIATANSACITDRAKHIDIRHHFIREQIAVGAVQVKHVSTTHQLADILTKPLSAEKFRHFLPLLGLRPLASDPRVC